MRIINRVWLSGGLKEPCGDTCHFSSTLCIRRHGGLSRYHFLGWFKRKLKLACPNVYFHVLATLFETTPWWNSPLRGHLSGKWLFSQTCLDR